MKPLILCDPPPTLLERLTKAPVSDDTRESALAWLRCVLVDFTALIRHIGLLQQMYDSPFRFPAARRDGGSPLDLLKLAEATKFPEMQVPTEDWAVRVMEGGVERLDNEELGRLLLSPYTLCNLFDAIGEVAPEAWAPVMLEVGRETLRREKAKPLPPPPVRTDTVVETPPVPAAVSAPVPVPVSPPAPVPIPSIQPAFILPSAFGGWSPRGVAGVVALAASLPLIGGGAVWLLARAEQESALVKRLDELDAAKAALERKFEDTDKKKVKEAGDLTASATPRYRKGKGGEAAIGLTVVGKANSFVTVVLLTAEGKPEVVPGPGTEAGKKGIALKAGSATEVPLPETAAPAALVVVTGQQANDAISWILAGKEYAPERIEEAERRVRMGLEERGFERAYIARVQLVGKE